MIDLIRDILAIILIPIWVVTCAWIDSEHYNQQQWVLNHRSRLFNRGVVISIITALNPLLGMYAAFIFWALFDGVLSTLRDGNLGWYYIGSVSGTDKFFSNKPTLYRFSKHISLMICFVLIVTIIEPFFTQN